MDLRDDVFAVDDQLRSGGHPQRQVKDRTVFRHIDVLAGEHRVPALRHCGFLGQVDQQPHGLVGHAVLRVIEVDALGLGRQPLAPSRIGVEQLAQVAVADLSVVAFECLPGLAFTERRDRDHRLSFGGLLARSIPARMPGRMLPGPPCWPNRWRCCHAGECQLGPGNAQLVNLRPPSAVGGVMSTQLRKGPASRMNTASPPLGLLLRLAGTGLLWAAAAMHLDLYLTGYRTIPTIGPLFLFQIVVAFALGGLLLVTPSRLAAAAGAGFALSTLGGYLLTVQFGLFGFREVRTTAGIVAG